MTNETKNTPEITLRDGALKATIWKNQSEKGPFYSVDLTRSFKQGENYRDTNSFSGSDLLKIARLAEKAYDLSQQYREQDRQAKQG